MTLLQDARELMYQRFKAGWGSTTLFVFDDEVFTEPANASWCRVSFRNVDSKQYTLGPTANRMFQRQASLYVQIFTPIGSGTRVAGQFAQKVRDIFEGVTIPGTDVNTTDVLVRENKPDGKWKQTTVEIKTTYYEQK